MKKRKSESLIVQFLCIICLVVSFLLGSAVVMNRLQNRILCENTIRANEKIMEQTRSKIEHFYGDMKNQITAMVYSPTVGSYLKGDSLEMTLHYSDLENVFTNASLIQEDILGIALYNAANQRIASAGKGDQAENVFGLVDEMEISSLMYLEESNTSYYGIYYPVYDLKSNQYDRKIGMAVFLMRGSNYREFLENGQTTAHTQVLLTDQNGAVIAAKETEELMLPSEEDENYYVVRSKLDVTGWELIYRIPEKELLGESAGMRVFSIVSYLLAATALLILVIYCYDRIVRPIQGLNGFVQRHPNCPQERLHMNRENELGTLAENLNQMLDEIERLNLSIQESKDKMYQLKLSKKQMELLAYRNQINPHFLYNTFECIRGMALYHEAEDIAEITMNLSDVFRYVVKGSDWATVGQEVAYVEKYAKIIQYRFGGRIQIYVSVAEELRGVPLPKLLLQPMVENAVFHGLEPMVGDGHVWVYLKKTNENHLMILVEDDGSGMTKETLETLKYHLNHLEIEESEAHVGLANICQRLKLYYEGDAKWRIDSEVDEGTCVTLWIPLKNKKEEGRD